MNKLQKLARLIQFTVKLICFSFIMFIVCVFNELSDGGLLISFFALISLVIFMILWSLIWDTKWENLFKDNK